MTPKQKRFVEEYLIDLNATQAAIRAGYSEKTAAEIGNENLRKPIIASAIEEALNERSEKTKIDAEWLLTRLAEEATADIADLYDENNQLKPMKDWPLIWRQGLVAGVDVEEMTVGGGKKIGDITKIKLSDRAKRLEMIGKHIDVSAFAERKEITGPNGGPIEVSDVGVNELARRLAFVLAKGANVDGAG